MAPPRINRLQARRALLCAVLLSAAAPLSATAAAPTAPFLLGIDQQEGTYLGQWLRRIYNEAFKRLDTPLEFVTLPLQRLSAMLERGLLDGECVRAIGYAAAHPALVRVDESVFDIRFSLFAIDPKLDLTQLDELRARGLQAHYRTGVLACEAALKRVLPADRLFSTTTTEQGLKMLLAGRSDVFCEVDLALLNELYTAQFRSAPAPRRLLDLAQATPLYPYLHPRRAELAPRLAGALRRMKAEGLVEQFRIDALRSVTPG